MAILGRFEILGLNCLLRWLNCFPMQVVSENKESSCRNLLMTTTRRHKKCGLPAICMILQPFMPVSHLVAISLVENFWISVALFVSAKDGTFNAPLTHRTYVFFSMSKSKARKAERRSYLHSWYSQSCWRTLGRRMTRGFFGGGINSAHTNTVGYFLCIPWNVRSHFGSVCLSWFCPGHISARETEAHEKLQAAEKMAEDGSGCIHCSRDLGDIVLFAMCCLFPTKRSGLPNRYRREIWRLARKPWRKPFLGDGTGGACVIFRFWRLHKGLQSFDQTFVLRKTRFDPNLMSFQGLLGASKVSPGPPEG